MKSEGGITQTHSSKTVKLVQLDPDSSCIFVPAKGFCNALPYNDPAWIEMNYEDARGIPVRYFNPDAVKGNKYKCGDGVLVRIPKIKGRIFLRKKSEWDSYVEYIYERTYDKESKQSRNKRIIIGMYLEPYTDFMYPNEHYYDYFDPETGELIPQKKEEEAEEKADSDVQNDDTAAAEDQHPSDAEEKSVILKEETPMKKEQTLQDLERVVEAGIAMMDAEAEQSARQEEEPEEQEVQERYHTYIEFHDRYEMLRDIVLNFNEVIDNQTKKRPDAIVSLYTIRKLNNIIRQLKEMCAGTVLDGYVELIDEPTEIVDENGNRQVTGLSYNDVQIITRQNNTMLRWFRYNCLKTPGQFEKTFGMNRDAEE